MGKAERVIIVLLILIYIQIGFFLYKNYYFVRETLRVPPTLTKIPTNKDELVSDLQKLGCQIMRCGFSVSIDAHLKSYRDFRIFVYNSGVVLVEFYSDHARLMTFYHGMRMVCTITFST